MALSTNIRNANLGYSLNDPADTWAERTDIKEAAQYRLSNSIAEATGSAVAKVKQLESYYFYFNEDGKAFGFDRPEDSPNGIQPKRIGLIAQELMAIEPSLVRKMDWLDLGPEDPEYYWVDYDAMYVLILDAMNELNARAEAAKVQLGMTPDVLATRAASTTIAPGPSNWNLTVTPTSGPEGSQSIWTLSADNIADGTIVGFRLSGQCTLEDISCDTPEVYLNVRTEESLALEKEEAEAAGFGGVDFDPETMGWATGIFTFSGGQAQVTLNYVEDGEAEDDETIIMHLKSPTWNGVKQGAGNFNVPSLSVTATITGA